jgi:hypothetical protein
MGRSTYLPAFEAIVGLVVPFLLAGPWVLMGLAKGIGSYLEGSKMPYPEMARQNALVFLLPAIGAVLGLINTLLLIAWRRVVLLWLIPSPTVPEQSSSYGTLD